LLTEAAEEARFTVKSPLHFYLWPDVVIFSPHTYDFLSSIIRTCTNPFAIVDIVIDVCTNANLKQRLLGYREFNFRRISSENTGLESNGSVSNAPVIDGPGGHNDFIGNPNNPFHIPNTHHNINMQILGAFIAAVGIAAIAVAFTVLNAATLGIPGVVVAGAGLAAALTGLGLFKTAYDNTNAGYTATNNYTP